MPRRSGSRFRLEKARCVSSPLTKARDFSPASAVDQRTAWAIVAFLWVTYCLNYTDRQAVFSIYPALRRDLGFSDAQLGLVGSTFTWTYSICMVGSGRLADLLRNDRV